MSNSKEYSSKYTSASGEKTKLWANVVGKNEIKISIGTREGTLTTIQIPFKQLQALGKFTANEIKRPPTLNDTKTRELS